LGSCGLDTSDLGQGPVSGCCEHVDDPSGFKIDEEFLDWLSDY